MDCQRCGDPIEPGEEREHFGRTLCEDCYMDALSPAKACDPWAVHSAKSFAQHDGGQGEAQFSDLQRRILEILRESGGIEPLHLFERLQVKPADLEREIATLRHMEKLRGELRDGRRYICLW